MQVLLQVSPYLDKLKQLRHSMLLSEVQLSTTQKVHSFYLFILLLIFFTKYCKLYDNVCYIQISLNICMYP